MQPMLKHGYTCSIHDSRVYIYVCIPFNNKHELLRPVNFSVNNRVGVDDG